MESLLLDKVSIQNWPAPPLNRKYLRATHDYHPCQRQEVPSFGGNQSRTVPLRTNDLIIVHLTHDQGWVDGTNLSSGIRGWLPTNYCSPYDDQRIRELFHALTRLWTACVSNDQSKINDATSQSHVDGLLSGVRHLLESINCLRRSDHLVLNNLTIQRTRAGLLSDLSTLVNHKAQLLLELNDGLPTKTVCELLEDYIFRAFRVCTKAARLLDIWTGLEAKHSAPDQSCTTPHQTNSPTATDAISQPINSFGRHPVKNPPDLLSSLSNRKHVPYTYAPSSGVFELPIENEPQPAPGLPEHKDRAVDFNEPTTFFDDRRSSTDSSERDFVEQLPSPSATPATELLGVKHRAFLDSMGSFIGLHMQSRPFSDIWEATNEAFGSCAALLSVLFTIRDKTGHKSSEFTGALVALQDRSLALSTAIPGLQKASSKSNETSALDLTKGHALINAATASVRCAADCVAQARQILSTHGDFVIHFENVIVQLPMLADNKSTFVTSTNERPLSRQLLPPSKSDLDTIRPQTSFKHQRTGSINVLKSSSTPDFANLMSQMTTNHTADLLHTGSFRNDSLVDDNSLHDPNGHAPSLKSTPISETVSSEFPDSFRASSEDTISRPSTRATTPDLHVTAPDFDMLSQSLGSPTFELLTAEPEQITAYGAHHVRKHSINESHLSRGPEGHILGGTLMGLIEAMTSQTSVPDPIVIKTFFSTFRCFTTSEHLAQALVLRYQQAGTSGSASTPARLRTLKLFRLWLGSYWYPEMDSIALNTIRSFASDPQVRMLPSSRQRLLELIVKSGTTSTSTTNVNDSRRPSDATDRESLLDYPTPIFTSAHGNMLSRSWMSQCSILDFDHLEIARQLTLMDHRCFSAITTVDLLACSSMIKDVDACHVSAITQLANNTTNYVTLSILLTQDTRKRAAIIKQWVMIANDCLALQNYDTLMAITCALQSSTIVRLKQTWASIATKTINVLEYLIDVVAITRNYASLRQRLANTTTPCLPFVGLYLTDLTFVDAGNPNHRMIHSNEQTAGQIKVINFDKWTRATKIIEGFQRFQTPYTLLDVPQLQDWLHRQLESVGQSDTALNTLYQRSLRLEPAATIDTMPARSHTPDLLKAYSYVGMSRLKAVQLMSRPSKRNVIKSEAF